MTKPRYSSCAVISLTLMCIVTGCSDSKCPVSGSVTYKGAPLANVNIVMIGDAGKVATGKTGADGKFESVTTEQPGDGALAGKYRVGITPVSTVSTQPGKEDYSAPPKAPFPQKYFSEQSSGLEIVVARDMAPVTLDLKD